MTIKDLFKFIKDLPENIMSSVRLIADDCVLYRNIKSPMIARNCKMTRTGSHIGSSIGK